MSIDLISQIDYPDSDGQPMSDNTLQFRWIVTIQSGIDYLFKDDPAVFVAGDLLWYPVEGDNKTRIGPDVMVAFGRPKGERGSYRQWVEGGIPPQVVFEVLSPSNWPAEMLEKRRFYERHGVEEYYEYDPDRIKLRGWLREGDRLVSIAEMNGWTSPRLGIRFEMDEDLILYDPVGQVFQTSLEVREHASQMRQLAEEERQRAEQAVQIALQERQVALKERKIAEKERQIAEQLRSRADQADQIAQQERQNAEQLRSRADQADQIAQQERQNAEQLRSRADQADQIAQQERQRAELADQIAQQERQRAELADQIAQQERQRADRLADRLRALGLDFDS